MSELMSTVKYDKFKISDSNRKIMDHHIDKLCGAIQQRNLLPYRPILVSNKMEVIDGQHRLMAAKKLGLPIYYQVIHEHDGSDIIMLNNIVQGWVMKDYIRHYAVKGVPAYVVLMELMGNLTISAHVALSWLGDRAGGNKGGIIRKGMLKEVPFEIIDIITKLDELYCYFIESKNKSYAKVLANRYTQYAIKLFYNTDGVDFDKLLSKIKSSPSMLKVRGDVESALIDIVTIYNHRSKDDLVSLVKGKSGMSIVKDEG